MDVLKWNICVSALMRTADKQCSGSVSVIL